MSFSPPWKHCSCTLCRRHSFACFPLIRTVQQVENCFYASRSDFQRDKKKSKMLLSKVVRPLLHKIYDNVSVSDGINRISFTQLRILCPPSSANICGWNECHLTCRPILISFSLFRLICFVHQLCRNVNAYTPLLGLKSGITGTLYKGPFFSTTRALPTSSDSRDNDSESEPNAVGLFVSIFITGEFFCGVKPTQSEIQSNFEKSSCICWLNRLPRWCHCYEFDGQSCPK